MSVSCSVNVTHHERSTSSLNVVADSIIPEPHFSKMFHCSDMNGAKILVTQLDVKQHTSTKTKINLDLSTLLIIIIHISLLFVNEAT